MFVCIIFIINISIIYYKICIIILYYIKNMFLTINKKSIIAGVYIAIMAVKNIVMDIVDFSVLEVKSLVYRFIRGIIIKVVLDI